MLALFITPVGPRKQLASQIVESWVKVKVTDTEQTEDQQHHSPLLGPVWSPGVVGHSQLLLLVLDDVDVDGGGRDVVRQAAVLPGGVLVDLLYGEDRLGDQQPHLGVVGAGGAGGDGVPVLPHHELWRPHHVTGQTLQLQRAAGVDQQRGPSQDINLEHQHQQVLLLVQTFAHILLHVIFTLGMMTFRWKNLLIFGTVLT